MFVQAANKAVSADGQSTAVTNLFFLSLIIMACGHIQADDSTRATPPATVEASVMIPCAFEEVPGLASTEDIRVIINLCMVKSKRYLLDNNISGMRLVVLGAIKESYIPRGPGYQ